MIKFPDGGIISISVIDLKEMFPDEIPQRVSAKMLIPAFTHAFDEFLIKHCWDGNGPQYFRMQKPNKSGILLTCNKNVPVIVQIEYGSLSKKSDKQSLIGASNISLRRLSQITINMV